MAVEKIWQLFPEPYSGLTLADIEWLRLSGMPVTSIKPRFEPVSFGYDQYYMKREESSLYVTSTTPEQETWIRLYWGDRAFVFQITETV